MYLSKLHLRNWRSYADAQFEFKEPRRNKSVVLVGALNGRGKTSFLTALYLGIFGRFGLRYCEGYTAAANGDAGTYRQAIERFRRDVATREEPTEIDITFAPTIGELEEEEVRIVRRWHFTGKNSLRQNDSEEVLVYVGKKLLKVPPEANPVDTAYDRIEKTLFPAHVAPAFFFDGEQAQRLIENMGETGIRKAVEVMFGTKIIDDVAQTMADYLSRARATAGGAKKTSEREQQLNAKVTEREELNSRVAKLQEEHVRLEQEKDGKERERARLQEELARWGGAAGADAAKLEAELDKSLKAEAEATASLTALVKRLGIALAVSRLETAILNQLKAEESREAWEGLRRGTIENKEKVLAVAMPEPGDTDPLLCGLSPDDRRLLRERFIEALERIYNPPPPNCATDFLLGHVRGDARRKVYTMLAEVSSTNIAEAQSAVRKLREARDSRESLQARNKRIKDLPQKTNELRQQLATLNDENQQITRKLALLEAEIKKSKADLNVLSADIWRIQEELARLEPEQKRMAVAERVGRALADVLEQLQPMTTRRLEDKVTEHFLKIADRRFKGGKIVLPHGATPEFQWPDESRRALETISGFEKRSFGIAFSLALAGITKRRVPLVIDTPLGNADSEYRPRTLEALAGFDSDQIIILTHDEEVTPRLMRGISKSINQTFLITFNSREEGSVVHCDKYFEE
jgi:DNA sulfur modification protein DndD